MPKYRIVTSKTIETEYEIDVMLPLNMGADTERLTDMQVRKAFENGSLADSLAFTTALEVDDHGEEKIILVVRGDKQIVPRLKTKRPKTTKQAPFVDDDGSEIPVSTIDA